MTKDFLETVLISGGLAGGTFDIAVGPANTGIIDKLLSVDNGALQVDAPVTLRSTGPLGATRTLDLSGIENDGRIVFLSIENTDLPTNNLVLSPSTSINGASSLTSSEVTQWILFHLSGGVWFALRQWPQNTVQGAAVRRLAFVAADWGLGPVDSIEITQSVAPSILDGEIGPHGLDVAPMYNVQVYDNSGAVNVVVGVEVEVDPATGHITMRKAGPDFPGEVIIIGDL